MYIMAEAATAQVREHERVLVEGQRPTYADTHILVQ